MLYSIDTDYMKSFDMIFTLRQQKNTNPSEIECSATFSLKFYNKICHIIYTDKLNILRML